MLNLDEMLNRLNNSIFSFEVQEIPVYLTDFFGAVIEMQAIDINNINHLQTYNTIMKNCLEAMQNRDYLLLSDILEYELKPLFVSVNKN